MGAGARCKQTTYLSIGSSIVGRSLVIAFALSRFWWHWQRKAKSARVWAQTREGGLGPGAHAEGPGHVQKGQGACR